MENRFAYCDYVFIYLISNMPNIFYISQFDKRIQFTKFSSVRTKKSKSMKYSIVTVRNVIIWLQ
jgi:hypothetical protein